MPPTVPSIEVKGVDLQFEDAAVLVSIIKLELKLVMEYLFQNDKRRRLIENYLLICKHGLMHKFLDNP